MPRLNIEALNKWLTAGASLAVIIGVIVAIAGVVVATRTLRQSQGAASATLVLTLRDKLDGDRFAPITNEIQDNDSAHPLTKDHGGKFRDIEVEQYISNFEDVGYLVRESVIAAQMAYDHFSYDVEKAWCNADVQRVVQAARKADRSITAATDPIYGRFEALAKEYLRTERQSCKDVESQ
jgi:hypothetical protein